MEPTLVAPSPGPAAPSQGSAAPAAPAADGSQTSAQGAQGAPEGGQPEAGAQPAAAAPERSLEELQSLSDSGNLGTLSPEERKKIRIAARNGFKTQAQFDEHAGKAKVAAAPVEVPDPAVTPPADPAAPNPLADIVKAISATLDPSKPAEAIASVKELQRSFTESTARVKQLEGYYPEVERGLIEQLNRGAEGVREIYARMEITPPANLFTGAGEPAAPAAPAAAPTTQPAGVPALSFPELDSLKDDDFLPVASFKGFFAKAIAEVKRDAVAAAMAHVKPLQDSHKIITDRITLDAKAEERKTIRKESLADAQTHSDFMGQFYPEEQLAAPAEEVWAASVDENGRFKADPHPEFVKLKKILEARRKEYIDTGHKAATYEHYLYEKVHKGGKMAELYKEAELKGRLKLQTQQQRRVQPALAPKGLNGGGGLASFVVPKTEAEVRAMTPEQRKLLKAKIYNKEIPIAT